MALKKKKIIGGMGLFGLVLTLVGSAVAAPVLPFATLGDAAKAQAGPGQPACNGDAIVLDLGPEWNVYASGSKAIFIHFTSDAAPDYVYVTSFATTEPYTLTVQEALSITEATAKYPSPCLVFAEKATS